MTTFPSGDYLQLTSMMRSQCIARREGEFLFDAVVDPAIADHIEEDGEDVAQGEWDKGQPNRIDRQN